MIDHPPPPRQTVRMRRLALYKNGCFGVFSHVNDNFMTELCQLWLQIVYAKQKIDRWSKIKQKNEKKLKILVTFFSFFLLNQYTTAFTFWNAYRPPQNKNAGCLSSPLSQCPNGKNLVDQRINTEPPDYFDILKFIR